MMDTENFVIIGAGHAGGVAVQAMRGAGHEGSITLIGDETHLPYERPPLSKELLQAVGGEGFRTMRDEAYYAENDVTLMLGVKATTIDAQKQTIALSTGNSLPYDKLLLTTGGDVRKLSIPGADLDGIHYLRTLDDSRAIEALLKENANLVVVGGGFIGLEVAASARKRGANVTVMEAMAHLMGRALPGDISAMFLDLHSENGVNVRLNDGVQAFLGDGHVDGIETSAGETIAADAVIVGVGIIPETALAESAGLTLDNGIIVDEFARTSNANIYAAGDNTNHFNPLLDRHIRLEAWQNAQNQAATAARNMCGANEVYAETPWMWSDQFDANLQLAGLPSTWGEMIYRGDIASRDFIGFQLKDDMIEAAIAVNRPRDMRVARRLMDGNARVSTADIGNEDISLRDILKPATG
jgi:NADPH-dependent 2,4-dienoyl-CoA reductase/sulfur reductase-like enzyme